MDNTAQACYPENGVSMRSLDERLYQSLSSLLKNVSDYLHSLEENVTSLNNDGAERLFPSGDSEVGIQDDIVVPESIWLFLQIFTLTGIVWALNRCIWRSSVIQQWTEAILAWILIFISIPILLPPMAIILAIRTVMSLHFKFQCEGKIQLMNPFDAVWSFENPNSTSTCVGLYVIKGDGDLIRIRNLLRTRVLEKEDENGDRTYDRFRWSIVKILGFMCWRKETPNFNINEHIRYFEGSGKVPGSEWTEEDLFQELGHLHDVSLIRGGKSPWEILIIPKFILKGGKSKGNSENHYAILFRIHHSIAGTILHK